MANQRKKGIERVTLTLPDELLEQIESEAERLGKDRLSLMREILAGYLNPRSSTIVSKKSAKKGSQQPGV